MDRKDANQIAMGYSKFGENWFRPADLLAMSDSTIEVEQVIIVVVEDEELVRLIAVEALCDAGFHVFEAEHAEAALAIGVTPTEAKLPGSIEDIAERQA